MRKIFIVDANSKEDFLIFISRIQYKIPNVISLNYYTDILAVPLGMMDTTFVSSYTLDVNLNKSSYYKHISNIEKYWYNINKKSLIQKVLDLLEVRDSPRTILFFLCNNRILVHHIRKQYGFRNVKTIRLKTNHLKEIPINRIAELTNHDIVIDIPDISVKSLSDRIISIFINNHIPVKWFVNTNI
jgi:hypothetical protein